jgi:hypothetical protein
MSYAYQVVGSEDGTIAICANRKRAIEKAVEYVMQTSDTYDRTDTKYGDTYIEGDSISARVERWFLS